MAEEHDPVVISEKKEHWFEAEARMERGEFRVGDHVEKHTGDYRLTGYVVAAFDTSAGASRFVVEHANGILHIYGTANLRPVHHDGLNHMQRRGRGWMVVGTDNFARETVADFVVAMNIRSQEAANSMARGLNADQGENAHTYYVAREHDAKLCAGMRDFI